MLRRTPIEVNGQVVPGWTDGVIKASSRKNLIQTRRAFMTRQEGRIQGLPAEAFSNHHLSRLIKVKKEASMSLEEED